MKRTTKMTSVVLVGLIGISGYMMMNHTKQQPISAVKENPKAETAVSAPIQPSQTTDPVEGTYPIIGSHGMFENLGSIEEISKNSELITEVKVLDQQTVSVATGEVSTVSTVNVVKTLKGDPSLTSLKVTEFGGLLDLSKIPDMNKPGKGHEPSQNKGIVESAFEGSPVMKKNQTYLVFLRKNPNPKWGYNIVGSVQGKLKIDGQTQKIVKTVDPKYINEEYYFMQRQFAGMSKSDVEAAIKSKL